VSLALTNARFANLIPAGHNGRSGMHDEGFRWLELWRELHFSFGGAPAAKIVARISNRVRLYFCTSPVPLLQIEICSLTRLKNTGKRLSRGFTVGVKLRASVEVGLDAPPKAFSGYPLALPSKEAGTHVAAVAALSPV
jgi:hypothetical protein